ncbi:MAG: serine/threonine-protein kinase [Minicystis sp.]
MHAASLTLAAPLDDVTAAYAPGVAIHRRYRLLEKLGGGGMGSVWRAEDVTLGREVAIKLIHEQYRDSVVTDRLKVEAQATAQLNHPAIVRVYDVGETDLGDPFLVMELLRGESLGAEITLRGRLPELSAVQLLLPIAGALVTAHAAGIVHRDIKPDNIMIVEASGEACARQPKLVDFGIARRDGPTDRRLTVKGALLGSPGYMAPEQALGRLDTDARVDVWAFSVVLYELVTGDMPFVKPTVPASLAAILGHHPRPTTEAGGDPELWEILRRGLAKDRDARWSTMAALREALVAWARARGATTDVTGASLASSRPPPPRASERPAPVIVPAAPAPTFELAFEPPPLHTGGTLYEAPRASMEAAPPSGRIRLSPSGRVAALALFASVVVSAAFALLAH